MFYDSDEARQSFTTDMQAFFGARRGSSAKPTADGCSSPRSSRQG
jgi:hypothetical protein